jgi:hypothetical protein
LHLPFTSSAACRESVYSSPQLDPLSFPTPAMASSDSPRSPEHKARNDLFRKTRTSPEEARTARGPTAQIVANECQRLGVQHRVEDIPDSNGARIHWIGDSSPRDVMVYFHGMVHDVPQPDPSYAARSP